MSWFKRSQEGITTSTEEKLEVPDGLWFKCSSCKKTSTTSELKENLYVCIHCNYHARINSIEYFSFIYDEGKHELLFEGLQPKDFLGFKDLKPYSKRIEEAKAKVNVPEAMSVAVRQIRLKPVARQYLHHPT